MTTMMSFRNLGRGASAAAITVLALCLLAGTALAYWTSTGTGFGQASVGTLGQPTISSVTAPTGSSSSLAVGWTRASAEAAPTSYRIDVAGIGGQSANSSCSTTSCSATVTGLAADTPYTVTVTSLLHNSWTAASNTYAGRTNVPVPSGFAFTTPAHGDPNAAPTTSFEGTTSDTNTVTINVHTGSDTSTAVIRTLTAPSNGVTWTSPAVSPALSTSATYTAVATQTNAGGTAVAKSTFTVPKPAPSDTTPPTQQIATPASNGSRQINSRVPIVGTATDPSGVTNLQLQMSVSGGGWANVGDPATAAAGGTATANYTWTVAGPTTATVRFRTSATDGMNPGTSAERTMTVAADTTSPTVVSIQRSTTNPAVALSSVSWTVTFSEAVTGVDTRDFDLVNFGVLNAALTTVTGSGYVWTVTASTGVGNGTMRLDLDDASIRDLANLRVGGSGNNNGNFSGEAFTVDNAPRPSGLRVSNGATSGQIDRLDATDGDVMLLTFSEDIAASSVLAGWDGTGTKLITATFTDGGASDSITVPGVGTITLGSTGYLTATSDRVVELTKTGGALEIEFVNEPAGNATVSNNNNNTTFTWTPVTTIKDLTGNGTEGSFAILERF